jgi:sulfur dioxygenase
VSKNPLIFHQLFDKETYTYTYLIADPTSKDAIIIDPTIDTYERDLNLIRELQLNLKYILDTHIHADHITGASQLKKATGAKIGISHNSLASGPDTFLKDGDQIPFGDRFMTALATPGHTNSCMSFYIDGYVFTGDTLLIRGTGRTDFQEGNTSTLYNSIRKKLFTLPDDTRVYPGHDYSGHTSSTIGQEKMLNPRVRLENTEEVFIQMMSNLKLDAPKRIREAVPANLKSGNISLHGKKE